MMTARTQDSAEIAATPHDDKLATIRNWLLEINPDFKDIDLDKDLFESSLVTSIQLVELVLLVEELSGREVTTDDNAVDRFRTLRSIAGCYFA